MTSGFDRPPRPARPSAAQIFWQRFTPAVLCAGLALLVGCADGEMRPPASPAAEAAPMLAPPAEESTSSGMRDERIADNRPMPAAPAAPGAPPPPPPPPGTRSDAGEAVQVRGPMLIYTAQITMAVFNVNASLAKVETLGRELGGFLAKRDDKSVTIRVPAQRFDEAVKRVEEVGDMLHRQVVAEDVTEQFRDLEIRLKSARAVQQRLTDLLARAAKVEESIAIERELDRVTGEIERIEGKMKFLRDRAVFSTITVTFDAKPREQVGGQVRLPVNWLYDLGLRRLLSL
ncbi:hypothetical protein A7982_12084 [Minicystis rosea]|nr:hypothetical protein A7982_12084 [Minicystis rosea]